LAKWPDDGYYYPSIVLEISDFGKYKLENNLKSVKYVHREDIITKSELLRDFNVTFIF
jgi:uncharacterized protein Usg